MILELGRPSRSAIGRPRVGYPASRTILLLDDYRGEYSNKVTLASESKVMRVELVRGMIRQEPERVEQRAIYGADPKIFPFVGINYRIDHNGMQNIAVYVIRQPTIPPP